MTTRPKMFIGGLVLDLLVFECNNPGSMKLQIFFSSDSL